MPSRRRGSKREPRFSVVTIVRNEADRLPRLLASLEEFRSRGGEVMVLDTGSDDGTPDVAAALGAWVVKEPSLFNRRLDKRQARRINETFSREGEGPFVNAGERLFDFGRARAHAASLARHDFQLAVDGGDIIEAMDVDHIDGLARSTHPAILHFETRIRQPWGWALELRDYLYDRRLAQWRGLAHNFLAPRSRNPASGPTRLARDQLLVSHHTDLQKKRGYQLAGTALEALKDPTSFRWLYFLGRTLIAKGHHHSARKLALRLDSPEAPPSARAAGLTFAAHCAAHTGGSADEVEGLLFLAARRDSGRRDPLLQLAQRRLNDGDWHGAVAFASAALAIQPTPGMSEPEENHSVRPHAILYWALLWLGRHDEAKRHFQVCRKAKPENPIYRDHARFFRGGGRAAVSA